MNRTIFGLVLFSFFALVFSKVSITGLNSIVENQAVDVVFRYDTKNIDPFTVRISGNTGNVAPITLLEDCISDDGVLIYEFIKGNVKQDNQFQLKNNGVALPCFTKMIFTSKMSATKLQTTHDKETTSHDLDSVVSIYSNSIKSQLYNADGKLVTGFPLNQKLTLKLVLDRSIQNQLITHGGVSVVEIGFSQYVVSIAEQYLYSNGATLGSLMYRDDVWVASVKNLLEVELDLLVSFSHSVSDFAITVSIPEINYVGSAIVSPNVPVTAPTSSFEARVVSSAPVIYQEEPLPLRMMLTQLDGTSINAHGLSFSLLLDPSKSVSVTSVANPRPFSSEEDLTPLADTVCITRDIDGVDVVIADITSVHEYVDHVLYDALQFTFRPTAVSSSLPLHPTLACTFTVVPRRVTAEEKGVADTINFSSITASSHEVKFVPFKSSLVQPRFTQFLVFEQGVTGKMDFISVKLPTTSFSRPDDTSVFLHGIPCGKSEGDVVTEMATEGIVCADLEENGIPMAKLTLPKDTANAQAGFFHYTRMVLSDDYVRMLDVVTLLDAKRQYVASVSTSPSSLRSTNTGLTFVISNTPLNPNVITVNSEGEVEGQTLVAGRSRAVLIISLNDLSPKQYSFSLSASSVSLKGASLDFSFSPRYTSVDNAYGPIAARVVGHGDLITVDIDASHVEHDRVTHTLYIPLSASPSQDTLPHFGAITFHPRSSVFSFLLPSSSPSPVTFAVPGFSLRSDALSADITKYDRGELLGDHRYNVVIGKTDKRAADGRTDFKLVFVGGARVMFANHRETHVDPSFSCSLANADEEEEDVGDSVAYCVRKNNAITSITVPIVVLGYPTLPNVSNKIKTDSITVVVSSHPDEYPHTYSQAASFTTPTPFSLSTSPNLRILSLTDLALNVVNKVSILSSETPVIGHPSHPVTLTFSPLLGGVGDGNLVIINPNGKADGKHPVSIVATEVFNQYQVIFNDHIQYSQVEIEISYFKNSLGDGAEEVLVMTVDNCILDSHDVNLVFNKPSLNIHQLPNVNLGKLNVESVRRNTNTFAFSLVGVKPAVDHIVTLSITGVKASHTILTCGDSADVNVPFETSEVKVDVTGWTGNRCTLTFPTDMVATAESLRLSITQKKPEPKPEPKSDSLSDVVGEYEVPLLTTAFAVTKPLFVKVGDAESMVTPLSLTFPLLDLNSHIHLDNASVSNLQKSVVSLTYVGVWFDIIGQSAVCHSVNPLSPSFPSLPTSLQQRNIVDAVSHTQTTENDVKFTTVTFSLTPSSLHAPIKCEVSAVLPTTTVSPVKLTSITHNAIEWVLNNNDLASLPEDDTVGQASDALTPSISASFSSTPFAHVPNTLSISLHQVSLVKDDTLTLTGSAVFASDSTFSLSDAQVEVKTQPISEEDQTPITVITIKFTQDFSRSLNRVINVPFTPISSAAGDKVEMTITLNATPFDPVSLPYPLSSKLTLTSAVSPNKQDVIVTAVNPAPRDSLFVLMETRTTASPLLGALKCTCLCYTDETADNGIVVSRVLAYVLASQKCTVAFTPSTSIIADDARVYMRLADHASVDIPKVSAGETLHVVPITVDRIDVVNYSVKTTLRGPNKGTYITVETSSPVTHKTKLAVSDSKGFHKLHSAAAFLANSRSKGTEGNVISTVEMPYNTGDDAYVHLPSATAFTCPRQTTFFLPLFLNPVDRLKNSVTTTITPTPETETKTELALGSVSLPLAHIAYEVPVGVGGGVISASITAPYTGEVLVRMDLQGSPVAELVDCRYLADTFFEITNTKDTVSLYLFDGVAEFECSYQAAHRSSIFDNRIHLHVVADLDRVDALSESIESLSELDEDVPVVLQAAQNYEHIGVVSTIMPFPSLPTLASVDHVVSVRGKKISAKKILAAYLTALTPFDSHITAADLQLHSRHSNSTSNATTFSIRVKSTPHRSVSVSTLYQAVSNITQSLTQHYSSPLSLRLVPNYNYSACNTRCGFGCQFCRDGETCMINRDCANNECINGKCKGEFVPDENEDEDDDGEGFGAKGIVSIIVGLAIIIAFAIFYYKCFYAYDRKSEAIADGENEGVDPNRDLLMINATVSDDHSSYGSV